MQENKTVPAFTYNAEGFEITIKVAKLEFTKLDPVKPGFIQSLIQSLPPELLLMFAETLGSIMNPAPKTDNAPKHVIVSEVTFNGPEGQNVKDIVDMMDPIDKIIATGMEKLCIDDRCQVKIRVDMDDEIEVLAGIDESLINFLINRGYEDKKFQKIFINYY